VAVPLPLEGSFHYSVSPELAARVRPGLRVLVPFGRRRISAYVLGESQPPAGHQLKAVLEVLDDEPLWTEQELSFFRWIADYYLHPLGEVLKTALPAGINLQSRKGATETITGGRKVLRQRIFSATGQTPAKLLRGKATEILAFLAESGEASAAELKARFGDCSPNLKRLTELGLIRLEFREVYRNPFSGEQVERDHPKELNHYQQAALQAVLTAAEQGGFAPFLLHGVTGSGKTTCRPSPTALVRVKAPWYWCRRYL